MPKRQVNEHCRSRGHGRGRMRDFDTGREFASRAPCPGPSIVGVIDRQGRSGALVDSNTRAINRQMDGKGGFASPRARKGGAQSRIKRAEGSHGD
jgi:hypothetical protein